MKIDVLANTFWVGDPKDYKPEYKYEKSNFLLSFLSDPKDDYISLQTYLNKDDNNYITIMFTNQDNLEIYIYLYFNDNEFRDNWLTKLVSKTKEFDCNIDKLIPSITKGSLHYVTPMVLSQQWEFEEDDYKTLLEFLANHADCIYLSTSGPLSRYDFFFDIFGNTVIIRRGWDQLLCIIEFPKQYQLSVIKFLTSKDISRIDYLQFGHLYNDSDSKWFKNNIERVIRTIRIQYSNIIVRDHLEEMIDEWNLIGRLHVISEINQSNKTITFEINNPEGLDHLFTVYLKDFDNTVIDLHSNSLIELIRQNIESMTWRIPDEEGLFKYIKLGDAKETPEYLDIELNISDMHDVLNFINKNENRRF